MKGEMIHNEHNTKQAVVNLPISLLRECKNKDSMLTIALSLFIKAHYGDSTIREVSVRNLIKELHVGQKKATKCFDILHNNDKFFMQTKPNSFIARTYKREIVKATNKRKSKIYECYCYKMTINKEWSLRDIETHLRDALITYAINAKERKEISSNCKQKKETLSNSSDWLTLSKLSNISGYSRSTTYRHINKMAGNGQLSVVRGSMSIVSASSSKEALEYNGYANKKVIITKNGLAVIVTPNEYHITDRKVSDSFINIIYNHKYRYTFNVNSNKIDDIFDKGIMGAYN